ncbi:MAG: radical SAM protein [Bacteroidetes bacterium]|nr:radical SAM protein [Bacteroidota bacterium]
MTKTLIPSVNFHLWEPCNMRCGFCFASFQDVKQTILPMGHLPKEQAIQIVSMLAKHGFKKITFAGGEPLLCPWLHELISEAKKEGMKTMVVTNASKLTEMFLQANRPYLDWVALSIDSLIEISNIDSGRAVSGNHALSEQYYRNLVQIIRKHGIRLKINTVVHRKNYLEDMNDFIRWAQPERWKVLQVLPIQGQNDRKIDEFRLNNQDFEEFILRHKSLEDITTIVSETNSQMKGSYVMVDPAGRFFDNSQGTHRYSDPILTVGPDKALGQVHCDYLKFVERKGVYQWE